MACSESIAKRSLLDIDSLPADALDRLLARACALADGAPPKPMSFTVAGLFFESSTRTRWSFELAARRLRSEFLAIDLDSSSARKGEGLLDTARTFKAMGVDGLVVRHHQRGVPHWLAESVPSLAVINAGDADGDHPSQALLDSAVLRHHGLNWSEATVVLIGDLRHSRVARSNLQLFRRLGVRQVRVAAPEHWWPDWLDGQTVERAESLPEAVVDADVIMMLRVQRERMDPAQWPDMASYHARWGLREEHLELAHPGCSVLHPGPINRGIEIADAVADGPQSRILQQVRMGVFMRMAIYEWLFQ